MKYENIQDIEADLKKVVDVDFRNILDKVKIDHLRETIKKYNVFKIKRHILADEVNSSKQNLSYRGLIWRTEYNFKQVEQEVKGVFDELTKEDKINEIMPYLNTEKIFNDSKEKYFSAYDFQRKFKSEDENGKFVLDKLAIKTEIEKRINALKEFCFSARFTDKYYKAERIREILEFLKYAYNINIEIDDPYNKDIKDIEKEINKNSELKIRIFKEFYYLSFTSSENQEDLRNRLINQAVKILGAEY